MILRSQADELDAIADVLEREVNTPSSDVLAGYTPAYQAGPPVIDPEDLPGDMTIAEPDGRADVEYNLNLQENNRINMEATLRMAKHDAMQGKIVFLNYGDQRNCIWTKETFD